MAKIQLAQRQVLPVGGNQVAGPSGVRVGIAGKTSRATANLGDTIANIGLLQQNANDSLEFESMSNELKSGVESVIATNAAKIQDPAQFKLQTEKDILKLSQTSTGSVGRRNKARFDVLSANVLQAANRSIRSQSTRKTLDLSKAHSEINVRRLLDEATIGMQAGDVNAGGVAIQARTEFLSEQLATGRISAEAAVKQDIAFRKEIAETQFGVDMEGGNVGKALKDLNSDKNLSAKEKLDMRFKVASRIDRLERDADRSFKTQASIRESDYDRLSLDGKLVKGFVSEDGLSMESLIVDAQTGVLSPEAQRRIIKQQRGIEASGGIGDESGMNELMVKMDDDFSITKSSIKKSIENGAKFNSVQLKKLYDAVDQRDLDTEKRLTSPLAKEYRFKIKSTHKVDALFGSKLLSAEVGDHFQNQMEVYRTLVLQGTNPIDAFAQSLEITGPIPGQSEASEGEMIRLETELDNIIKSAADETQANKGRWDRNSESRKRKRELDNSQRRLVGQITEMKNQIRIAREIEGLTKNANTGKRDKSDR